MLFVVASPPRQLRCPTNLLLLSLAVSDLLVGLLVIPVDVLMLRTCWALGDLVCALYYFLPLILVLASVGNMVLISVDRYVAICDPLRYPARVTERTAGFSICVCWSFSLFYTIFLLYDELRRPGRSKSCHGECVVSIAGDVDLVVAFVLPVTTIIVLYVRVFAVSVAQARAIRLQVVGVSLRTRRSELKAARTLGVVVAVFLMCYCPYYCLSLSGSSDILIGSDAETFLSFVLYFNSCLNPLIYTLLYPWFRKALRLIVTLQILQPGSSQADVLSTHLR